MLIAYLNGSNHRLHRLYMIIGLIFTDICCGNSMSFLSVTFHLWVMHSHTRFGRTRFCSSEKKEQDVTPHSDLVLERHNPDFLHLSHLGSWYW